MTLSSLFGADFNLQDKVRSFIDIIKYYAEVQPEKDVYIFLKDGEVLQQSITYKELDLQARSIAATLQASGSVDRAMLVYSPGIEFIKAFFGCLYAGVTSIPVYLPSARAESWKRLRGIMNDAEVQAILLDSSCLESVNKWLLDESDAEKTHVITTELVDTEAAKEWIEPSIHADKLAFLQYTSGSTGDPKGVMVSHGNLLHNQALIGTRFCHTQDSVVVGWLPQYHDMGLIGNILHPAYIGSTSILMSPVSFLQKPVRWLQAITKYKATTSGGPNFAFELCAQRITEEDKKELDLSGWDLAFNGAEPIHPDTLENFYQAFKSCGFKKEVFYPCYGLAESTLFVSGVEKGEQPVVKHVDRKELENNNVVIKLQASESTFSLVSCGTTELGVDIQIVNPDTQQSIHDGSVGEIWVSGESIAHGYWRRDELSKTAFYSFLDGKPNRFLRTGDLGFICDGNLYVSGRLKDLIILRGKNYYPQDIEAKAQEVSAALKPSRGIAFLNDDKGADQASIVLVQEIERTSIRKADFQQLEKDIKQAIFNIFELNIEVVIVKPGHVPITSSGKVRRSLCKSTYLQNGYQALNAAAVSTNTLDAKQECEELIPKTSVEHFAAKWITSQFIGQKVDLGRPLLDYGLDSMKAAQLQYDIESELEVVYPMEKLLNTSSLKQLIDELTSYVSQKKTVISQSQVSASDFTSSNQNRLSSQQMMFWQLNNKSNNTAALNLSVAVEIKSISESAFSLEAFRGAFDAYLEQQAILRTVYIEHSGEPECAVKPISDFNDVLSDVDGSSLAQDELNKLIEHSANQPFDLKNGPICRATIYQLAEGRVLFHFVVHHIAMDAWSLQISLQQIAKNYELLANGHRPPETQTKFSYQDYSESQLNDLSRQDQEESRKFWQSQFEGLTEITELPTDKKNPKEFDFSGANHDLQLSPELCKQINMLAKRKGVTPYTLILSVYKVLLHKFMGNENIVVGTPISQRPMVDYAQVAGCFVDVKPVCTRIQPNMSFDTLLDNVKNTFLSVLEHKCYPSQQILQIQQLKEVLSVANAFPNVRFALQKAHELESIGEFFLGTSGASIDLHGLQLSSYDMPSQITQAELALTVVESEQKMWLRFNYSSQLFETETVAYLAQCCHEILCAVIRDSGQDISHITLPRRGNGTIQPEAASGKVVPLSVRGVHQLFEQQAVSQPDAIAVVCAQQSVTYAELNQRANIIAHKLLANGVTSGSNIAIYMHRSAEMVAAFLAGLKVGACCVLLEPDMSPARCKYILEDSKPRFVLKNDSSLSLDLDEGVVELVVDEELCRNSTELRNPDLPVSDLDAAYVIYTSGSTGEPKGVIGIHKGMINRTQWMIETFGITSDDVILHCTPMNFVRAEREIFYALSAGAQLVLLQQNALNEPASFLKALQAHKVTFTATSPAHIKTLLDYDLDAFSRLDAPRNWFIGADVLDQALVSKLQAMHNEMTLSYFYGSTETTSDVSCFTIPKDYQGGAFTTPIGHPLNNTDLYILDETMSPVPCGGKGELFVAGHQISRGYLNADELTAQKYIANPFSSTKERLYRTGDLARKLSNGDIIILGRKDSQVNLNGFRIDLSEVEHGLYSHKNVKDVAVRIFKENKEKQYIVAYVVLADGVSSREGELELRQHVQGALSDYMQPGVYVFVDKLPRTELGKLNHRLLPDPKEAIQNMLAASYVEPDNELEVILVAIWEDILQVEQVGVEDNFYQLGGNSLLSVKIVAEIEESTGVSITLKEFFEALTIRALAEKILMIAMQDMSEENEL
ncbi:hypothetical protein N480_21610 [Pseudoalteromonas luteoviolacea S2607]|uniref:non-ribosomal peptide synthetase n=1 Tax=Pseudoalteromonas luteoviolacea TaxID=43657 RepID=UPI0007B0A30A|nr:non-ribosomal peptide synthetase [Pseudoalteromonas luteoviolacea]KZN34203.1 hypothetical protein N480_21610 [Pseudoalteromonas luteoviolacea S2607]